MAPPRGLSTPRAQKVRIQKNPKSDLVTKHTLRAPIWTIFCMREAIYISHGLRILPGPLGL